MTSRHILVVDDEPDIRSLVQEILEDEGYTVTTADGGEAARKARRARRPDLISINRGRHGPCSQPYHMCHAAGFHIAPRLPLCCWATRAVIASLPCAL